MRKVATKIIESRFIIIGVKEANGLCLQDQGLFGSDFAKAPGSDWNAFCFHHILLVFTLGANLGMQGQQTMMGASGGILVEMELDGRCLHTCALFQLGNHMLGAIAAAAQNTVPVRLGHGPDWLAHHGVGCLF